MHYVCIIHNIADLVFYFYGVNLTSVPIRLYNYTLIFSSDTLFKLILNKCNKFPKYFRDFLLFSGMIRKISKKICGGDVRIYTGNGQTITKISAGMAFLGRGNNIETTSYMIIVNVC